MKLLPYRRLKTFSNIKEYIDWGVQIIGASDVWKLTQGEGVSVAVLDTGSSPSHIDLKDSFVYSRGKAAGFNAAGSNANDIIDRQSHGTHCSGIIAANRNGKGIIGIAPKSKIIPVKVLTDVGAGDAEMVVRGIEWVIKNAIKYNIRIMSMSLGSQYPSDELRNVLKAAKKCGLITVCAAGNEGNISDLGYPARYAEEKLCIAVGAVKSNKKITEFSNTGKGLRKMGIAAPGFEILSTVPNNKYAVFSGTSMAAPHISGILALAIAKHQIYGGKTPLKNLDDAYSHLKLLCEDLGVKGADSIYGLGLPVITEAKFKLLKKW